MTIGRNAPCPCGSGKKYKKCCLKKQDQIQMKEHEREQFYHHKHLLVDKMREFIVEQVPFNMYHQLKSQFRSRLNSNLKQDGEEQYFQFWLHFFHEFDSGLRGVEWFYKENELKLSREEAAIAKKWTTLQPKLLQAVNKGKEGIVFQDILTKKEFTLSDHEENLPYSFPWLSTFALLEEFQNLYYFNGVRSYGGPDDLSRAELKVNELVEETNKTSDQVLVEYYPEILSAMLSNISYDEMELENYLNEYKFVCDVNNQLHVVEFLKSQSDLSVQQWNEKAKVFGLLGNWRAFKDNQLNKDVHIADVDGRITITDGKLNFSSFDEEKTAQMKERLQELGSHLTFVKEHVTKIPSYSVQMRDTVVSIEKDTPKYYALYAQNGIINEIDQPIPLFDHLSLQEMKEQKRLDDIEAWLKQTEFEVYRMVWQQFNEVEVTADFNTVRKKLSIPLSPFVTGGADRESIYEPLDEAVKQPPFTEDDIPYLEELGFIPDTAVHFYVADMIRFYKERTIEKSEATVRKYTSSLRLLRILLEGAAVSDWDDLNLSAWESLLTVEYFNLMEDPSKTERKKFLSTVRIFLNWLEDVKEGIAFHEELQLIKKLDKDVEKELVQS